MGGTAWGGEAAAVRLDGRLEKLERLVGPRPRVETCRGCGLVHIPYTITIEFCRSVIGPVSLAHPPDGWPPPSPPLCLCDCCARGRRMAELTHR